MFSPGSVEKSSMTLSENSPTRGNFAVGMNSLGDENQQNIRIQLAVHRYNNSPGCSFIRPMNERSSSSVFKHGFLKSTQKYKNCDGDKEDVHNGLKKSYNQYQGVGNFPVVHLKKNTVIGKPVKRSTSNEFKIQLPELPFNRFLNHSPDICIDTKTSTRSVLDVLQDLSRKRIHTKDDTEANKRKCKGLGGDTLLDFEAPYKPLFVPKNKINTVTYRDSMTQTQEMSQFDSTYSKKNDLSSNNDKNDPKAELRRKLARQNNEIFASLSSSTLTYPLKRNSEKISGKAEVEQVEPKSKRSKLLSVENNGKTMQNGGLSSKELSSAKNHIDQLDKVDKKQKPVDSNKISPNKDRLTAIFLEMQNINPKLEVLAKNKVPDEKENLQSTDSVQLNGEKEATEKDKNPEKDKLVDNSGISLSSQPSQVATINTSPVDSSKISNGNAATGTIISGLSGSNDAAVSKEVSLNEKNNETPSTTTSFFSLPISSNINFGFSPETSSNFKIPVASTISSSLTQTPIFSTGISEKANSEINSSTAGNKVGGVQEKIQASPGIQNGFGNLTNPLLIQSPGLGEGRNESQEVSLNQNTSNLSKFGSGVLSNQPLTETQTGSPGTTSNVKDIPINAADQPSSNTGTPSVTSSQSLTSAFPTQTIHSSSALAVNTTTVATTITSTTATTTTTTATVTTATTATTTTASFTQSAQSTSFFTFSDKTSAITNQTSDKAPAFQFSFGQTSTSNSMPPSMFNTGNNITLTSGTTVGEGKPLSNGDMSQEKPNQVSTTMFTQNNFPSNSFLSTTPSFGQNAGISSPQNNQNIVPFKFGEKTDNQNVKPNTETSMSSTSSNIFDKKPDSNIFNFGQKPAGQDELQLPSTQTAASQPNLFQSGVFTFGQKTSTPVTSSQITGGSGIFGQNSSAQTNLFQQNNASQPNTTISNSLLSTSSPFGMSSQTNVNENKSQIPSFIQTTSSSGISTMNNSFTQNKISLPNFGASASSFGQPTSSSMTNEGNVFGSNTSQNAPSFGAGSAVPSSPFSQPFGDNSNKQQNNNNPASNFFMQSSTAQNSGFGQNSVFGSNSFGQNANENNIFGQKPQGGGFDQNQNIQSSPFGQGSISQTFGSQAPFTFGAPSTTSAPSSFSLNPSTASSVFTFGGSTKTTAASTSNFGFSSTSQPSSSSQSLFTFSGQGNNNTFKFGASTGNATGSGSGSFSFDANQSASDASKPSTSVFNFGGAQTSTQNTGFNFGAAPSPVFSFGESSAQANNPSKFSFGATQPNSGIFSAGLSPTPTMPLQGVFSIGSGSSQPRNRNTSARARRRT